MMKMLLPTIRSIPSQSSSVGSSSHLKNPISTPPRRRRVTKRRDNDRHGLCKDLGFSDADREENIRRIGEVAKLFLDSGVIVLTAFVSPFRADRDKARSLVDDGDFIEIHCAADLEVCESRDPKGLYAKARAGQIKEFTGISSPYEAPQAAELKIDTGSQELAESVDLVIKALQERGVIPAA